MATPIQSTTTDYSRNPSRASSSIVEPETVEMTELSSVDRFTSKSRYMTKGGISNAMSRYLQELAEAKKNRITIPWK